MEGHRLATRLNPFLGLRPIRAFRRVCDRVAPPGLGRITVMALLGVVAGLALLAFRTSNAASYLSDAPETCINCHVMTPYYGTWARSSHKTVATCNDCHVPQDHPARTWLFKGQDGMRHAYVFTMRREPQVLRLNDAAVPVIQQNCVRCHGDQIDHTPLMDRPQERLCWDCHRETPHGRTLSLSATPHVRRPRLPAAGFSDPKDTK